MIRTDIYLGALIGIIVSFKTLLYDLPNRKLAFAFNSFLLHKMVGGIHNTSWEKFYVALVTYLLVEQFEAILNAAWDYLVPIVTGQAAAAIEKAEAEKTTFPMDSGQGAGQVSGGHHHGVLGRLSALRRHLPGGR